ncbi:MAG: DUF4440 domain-containing protein [Gemmatimonadota bacterium]
MTSLIRFSIALSAVVFAASSAPTRAHSQVSHATRAAPHDTTATKAALLAAERALAHAVENRGAQAFLDALAPDAAVLFSDQIILRGPDAVRAAYLARYDLPSHYTWMVDHVVVGIDGNFGCTVGRSHFDNRADTVRMAHRGVYVTCWRRAADGMWRIVAHQRNDSPAIEPELADGVPLALAPHSATVSLGRDQRAQMLATETAFAAMGAEVAGPGPAFAHFVAPDGILWTVPDMPRGPEQLLAAFTGFSPGRVLWWGPSRSFGFAAGGLGYTTGYSVNRPAEGSAGRYGAGKFLTIWRQNADTTWSYVIDSGSPRPW